MKFKKEIIVKHSPEFEKQLSELRQIIKEKDSKFHTQLLRAIEREKKYIELDSHHGKQVPKSQIPKIYIEKYGVRNLWKINLPDFWRMIYTITGDEIQIISILLEFMDHKDYNKVFGYKKK